jgi:uroporphyrinogen III methyltransferase/synthase
VSGHKAVNKPDDEINWAALAALKSTLVFYMGVSNLGKIASGLIENGKSQDTPVAIIRRGTTHDQQIVTGTLSDIQAQVRAARLTPPALIVVGEVVELHEQLDWYK